MSKLPPVVLDFTGSSLASVMMQFIVKDMKELCFLKICFKMVQDSIYV